MVNARWSLLLFFTAAVAFGQYQRPVKSNLLAYFDKITPPPATAKEAHDKCNCNIPGYDGQCTSDNIFKPFEEELIKLGNEMAAPAGSQAGDMMKKMQDPDFQKKMQTMSTEEKMKFAMQMQQSMGSTTTKPESPAVMAAINEFTKLSQANSEDMTRLGEVMQVQQKEQVELAAKHGAVDEWKAQEIKKLPMIASGELSEPEPKKVYEVNMNAWKKHIAIADEHLKTVAKRWADEKSRARKLFAAFESSLEKIHYGDDAVNDMSRSSLSEGQKFMITRISGLAGDSKAAFDEGAEWYERMVWYQKQQAK